MVDYRTLRSPVGILIGLFFCFNAAWAFNGWTGIDIALGIFVINPTAGIYNYVSKAFTADLDIIGFFSAPPADIIMFFTGLFNSTMLTWIISAGIAACIAKGLKKGLMAAVIVYVSALLIWILLGILSGVDLLAMFSGDALIGSVGTILGGLIGILIGGSLFGLASGPSGDII